MTVISEVARTYYYSFTPYPDFWRIFFNLCFFILFYLFIYLFDGEDDMIRMCRGMACLQSNRLRVRAVQGEF